MMFSGLRTWRQLIRSFIARSLAESSRRKALKKRRSGYDVPAVVERLEDRTLLSISTPVLGSSNDVVFNGDAGVDSITFSVSNGGLLQHNLDGS